MNFDPNDYNELTVTESPIPGLFVIKLPVHGDNDYGDRKSVV